MIITTCLMLWMPSLGVACATAGTTRQARRARSDHRQAKVFLTVPEPGRLRTYV